jgi:hypothetical protein
MSTWKRARSARHPLERRPTHRGAGAAPPARAEQYPHRARDARCGAGTGSHLPGRVDRQCAQRNGLRTGRGNFWTRERVTSLRSHHEIPVYSAARRAREGWLNLTEAARLIGVSARTLRLAVERGELAAEHPLADGPWIFNRQTLMDRAAVELAARARARTHRRAIPNAEQGILDVSRT